MSDERGETTRAENGVRDSRVGVNADVRPHLNYVDVVGKGCEGWLNLFVGDLCICLVNDVEAADKIRSEVRRRAA